MIFSEIRDLFIYLNPFEPNKCSLMHVFVFKQFYVKVFELCLTSQELLPAFFSFKILFKFCLTTIETVGHQVVEKKFPCSRKSTAKVKDQNIKFAS